MGILPIPRTLNKAFKCKKSKSGCRKRNVSCSRFSYAYTLKRPPYSPQWHIRQPILLTIVGHREAHAVQT